MDTKTKMLALAKTPVDDQAGTLLKAFTATFAGDFLTVLKMAEDFKKEVRVGEEGRDPNGTDATLNEVHAQNLLGEGTCTSVQLRKYLQDIHLLEGKDPIRFPFIAWVLLTYSLKPDDVFAVHTNHQHGDVRYTQQAMTDYQQFLIAEGNRQAEMELLKIDAEAGGLDGGRAMIRLKLLENTGAEERGKAEVMLSKAQRAAKRYLKANNPFEAEKRLAEAQAEAEKEAAAEKRRTAKAKIASIGAIFEGN